MTMMMKSKADELLHRQTSSRRTKEQGIELWSWMTDLTWDQLRRHQSVHLTSSLRRLGTDPITAVKDERWRFEDTTSNTIRDNKPYIYWFSSLRDEQTMSKQCPNNVHKRDKQCAMSKQCQNKGQTMFIQGPMSIKGTNNVQTMGRTIELKFIYLFN